MNPAFRCSLISAAIAFAPVLAHAGDEHWRVVETSGPVELSSANGFVPVSVSNDVNPGSVLRTGATGRVVIEHNGDRITLAPNSEFKLPAQNTGPIEQVQEKIGTALYDMVPRGIDRFRVETPYLAALIKGTVFTVSVTAQGSAVEVLRGVVQATDGAGKMPTLVYPGQTATVMANAKGEVHLLGKPPASAPKSNAPAAPQETAPKSAAASEETANADTHAGGFHIEHTIGPQTVAIGALTKGLIMQVDTAPGNSETGKSHSEVQTASLDSGFSGGGKGVGNRDDDFAAAGLSNGNGGIGKGSGDNGIGNGLGSITGSVLNNVATGNGGGLGNGLGKGLGSGTGSAAISGGGSLGLSNGGSNGLSLGLTNVVGTNGNNGNPGNGNPGGNGNAGNGNAGNGNAGNGNAGGNGNGGGGNGNGNGKKH